MIYAIPLDNARQDAAPHGHSGGPGGGGSGGSGHGGSGGSGAGGGVAGGGGGSAGGSSSGGTGGATNSQAVSGTVSSGGAVLVPGGQPGSLIHSGNGFGSSSAVPGLNVPASSGLRAVQSDASHAPLIAVLLAIGVLGVGAFVGSRSWRGGQPHDALATDSAAPLPPASSS